jgi:hypothetical protein
MACVIASFRFVSLHRSSNSDPHNPAPGGQQAHLDFLNSVNLVAYHLEAHEVKRQIAWNVCMGHDTMLILVHLSILWV